jgi:nucleoside-diphosphate-sugar epimerase
MFKKRIPNNQIFKYLKVHGTSRDRPNEPYGKGELMSVLVVGASGATGRLLVDQLLDRGLNVKAIVRSPERLPEGLRKRERLTLIQAGILDLGDEEMSSLVSGCTAVASCLGHHITLKGLFGPPRRLVADAVRRLCEAIRVNQPEHPVRFVLMNTTACMNPDLGETRSRAERCVFSILRRMLPPHADNEAAAGYLQAEIGQSDGMIEWVAVRPDGLTDEDTVTQTVVVPSPVRSPVFNAGKTSRINAAHFMADLITNDGFWERWKGKMPVIYNASSLKNGG